MTKYGRSSASLAMRPELKYKDFVVENATLATGALNFLGLYNINQGVDRDQRIGRRVRVVKVQMVGGAASVGNASCDIHLWSPRGNSDPTMADFTEARGSLALDTGHSWFHWTQYGGTQSRNVKSGVNGLEALNSTKYFPKGLQMFYTGDLGTSCDRDRLYWVIICNALTDSVGEYGFSVRLWYYDI